MLSNGSLFPLKSYFVTNFSHCKAQQLALEMSHYLNKIPVKHCI